MRHMNKIISKASLLAVAIITVSTAIAATSAVTPTPVGLIEDTEEMIKYIPASTSPAKSEASNELKAKLSSITDMSATFQQQVIDDKGKVVQSSEGKMWVKKPQQFRWEVAEPYAQIIVADQKQVWLYDQDLEQAVVRKLDQQISNVPALLISGDVKDLNQHYQVSKSTDAKGKETFVLKPNQHMGDALFVELQASFVDGKLAVMRLVDNLGQFTHIGFSNIVNNKAIDNDVFKLNLPEHVDIIYEDAATIED